MKTGKLKLSQVREASEIIGKSFLEKERGLFLQLGPLSLKPKQWRRHYTELSFYVSVDKRKVAGICGLYGVLGHPRDVLWLSWLSVDPSKRRKGIGKSLLGYVERQAAKKGTRLLCAEVLNRPESCEALKLYAESDFRRMEGYPSSYPIVFLEKELKQ